MAQTYSVDQDLRNIMSLTGQGQVAVQPDTAVIHLGVQTTGMNLTEIQAENARISQNIIQALGQTPGTEIKTYQYTIEKLYEYKEGEQIDNGYSVRHILEIRTSALDQVGNIIDTAVKMGANIVDFISFELSEPDPYYQHALNLAVDNAIQKARSIASNLRIRLNPVPIRITENTASPVPMQQFQREVATPIIPGQIKITAVITAEFSY